MNFPQTPRPILNHVSLSLPHGASIGLIGESGSGKTTLARCLVGLCQPTSGAIRYRNVATTQLTAQQRAAWRRDVQMIFQDPYGSLNPHMTIGDSIAEPLRLMANHPRREIASHVARWLETVGLPVAAASRYPHEFSGGQRQRICIARALIIQPKLLICDEPVSALDVSVQAQILNLLRHLQQTTGMGLLLIAHNLAIVQSICDEVHVLQHGEIREHGPTARVFANPQSAYTQSLLASVIEPPAA